MACNTRRDISPCVQEIVEEERRRRLYGNQRTFICHTCSKAKIEEVVLKADAFHTKDPRVKYIVAHRIACPHYEHTMIYDKMRERCFRGNTQADTKSGRCSTCKHAEAIVVVDTFPGLSKYARPYTVHKTLYRCTNRNRLEQLNKEDVYMCGYISCDNYEEVD